MNTTTMKALDGRDHAISVNSPTESLASSLEYMMVENTFLPSRCCIFKTPNILYRHKEQAYIPNAFSFGPFHHGKPNLTETEKIKSKYLQGLISRSHSPVARLRQCIDVIMEVEEDWKRLVSVMQEIKHIIDLLRKSLLLPFRGEDNQHCFGWQPFPSATSIKEAGIKFRKVASSSILDIRFSNGILEMPSLLIQETTETIFRNLISFEQCYPNCTPRVTSYVILLSHLINTSKDLDILCDTGIIDNWMIPEDSIKFFKTLYHDSYVKSSII